MSRYLETALIFVAIVAGFCFAAVMANEIWDFVWKIRHQ